MNYDAMKRRASKMRPKHFKVDYKVTHDLFQVVREGNLEDLDKLLGQERNSKDSRFFNGLSGLL